MFLSLSEINALLNFPTHQIFSLDLYTKVSKEMQCITQHKAFQIKINS